MGPRFPIHVRGIHRVPIVHAPGLHNTATYCKTRGVYINPSSSLALHKMGAEYRASENATPLVYTTFSVYKQNIATNIYFNGPRILI